MVRVVTTDDSLVFVDKKSITVPVTDISIMTKDQSFKTNGY